MRLFGIVVGGGALTLAGACTLTTTLSGLADGKAPDGDAGDAAVDVAVADAGQDRLVADAAQDGSATSVLGCGAADAGLLAYWPMDEGLGTTVVDCSGHGLDGTLLGAGTWVAGRRPTTKAILFDATSATFVNIPASALADATTTITLAAWVNLGPGNNSYVIHKGQPRN